MERLTQWFAKGEAGIAAALEEQYTAEELVNILSDRLAAYEDTGLEPEEIRELCTDDVAKIAKLFRHMIEDGSIDHLQELLEAEKAGRLVVLPCKVGNTVYVIGTRRVIECYIDEAYLHIWMIKKGLNILYHLNVIAIAMAARLIVGGKTIVENTHAMENMEKGKLWA